MFHQQNLLIALLALEVHPHLLCIDKTIVIMVIIHYRLSQSSSSSSATSPFSSLHSSCSSRRWEDCKAPSSDPRSTSCRSCSSRAVARLRGQQPSSDIYSDPRPTTRSLSDGLPSPKSIPSLIHFLSREISNCRKFFAQAWSRGRRTFSGLLQRHAVY